MIDNLLDDAKQLLMQPLSLTFDVLPKIVRDLARDQDKEAEISIQGGEIELDRRIQEEIKDPLIHLIRNCIDHGIETPAVRARLHKPAHGMITINVAQKDAGKVEITIADDGSGIDHAKVLAAAQKSGAITPDDAAQFSGQETASLIFRSGVSTSPIVTDISGRGLGLAIVREKIERLGGSVSLESRRSALLSR
jgi:two-component system chemotaxis sensor kinase CheA